MGSKMAVNITRADIERYRTRRRDEVSGSTVNRELGCLRAVYNKAILWNLLEKNPAANIDMFPEKPRVRFLREEEQRRLLEACKISDQPLLYPIAALGMLTGLRRGELLALEWRHIDLQRKILTVEHGKGDKSRIVPLCPQAVLVIEQMSRNSETHRLFPTNSIKKSFTTALKRAGITDSRFHDLRHCFASTLAAQGTDLLTIRDLLGHTTIEMAMRYSHLSNAKLRDAVNGLPDVLPQTAVPDAAASVPSRHTAI